MAPSFEPGKTSLTRVFLIEGRARPDHAPSYESCMMAGAPSQSFGDVEKIECPDPDRYGQFVEIGSIQGAEERATIDLTGRYALDVASTLLRLAKLRCANDIQIHMGACKDPNIFNQFDKALILEDAQLTNWSTGGDLGTLASDGNAVIDETVSVSVKELYEALPLKMVEKAADIVTTQVLDVVICDVKSCGDCEDESDGCYHIYAVTEAAGGSPSTPPDIVFSVDKGATWYADDIDSLGAAESADAIGCVGLYIVVVSNDSNSLHYALKSEVNDVDYDETWTEVTTGFVAGGEPRDCWGRPAIMYIVGDFGYIYSTTDPTAGVTVLDAGVATSSQLNAVHALTDDFAVAVGNDGAVVYTEDGLNWSALTTQPVGVGTDLNCVWCKTKQVWLVGDNAGSLWYTLDQGVNWTLIADFGAEIHDVAFSTDSVGYVAVETATPRGQIRRTFDGGYSWIILPEDTGTMPASDEVTALAACSEDPNFVVGGGLADDGTDGFIVVGND